MIISNKLNITYNAIMPDGKVISGSAESNTVTTEILTYSVLKDIRPDKTTVRIGESVLYTVTITDNSSTKLFNNSFAISHPDGASYVADSVKINGVAQPSYDPVIGFVLPDLNPDDTVIIEYELKADKPITVTHFAMLQYTVNDPLRSNVNYTENTDAVSLTVISDRVDVVKTVDKSYACKGEQLHYTINVINTGNIAKTDLVFKDPIPVGTTFVENSIRVNGIAYSSYNPETGFVLRKLSPGEKTTIEFDVKVN